MFIFGSVVTLVLFGFLFYSMYQLVIMKNNSYDITPVKKTKKIGSKKILNEVVLVQRTKPTVKKVVSKKVKKSKKSKKSTKK